ncbi:hypothetical protein [Polaribacter aestuariivivens]|uniref:hypothetical protein n=1 Tax=Polaribacter aestuariivivens TaxID=2304626 RepID=UPI003F4964CA
MKEIVIKFLETQSFTTILAEITALFIAWQSWKKFKEQSQKEKKNKFLNALNGSENIDVLLKELQDKFTHKNIIPTLAEVTNGGGIPKADRPLYIKAINSTNSEVLHLWGAKTLVVSALNKAIIQLVNKGFSFLDIERFDLKKVEFWAGAKHIERVHYFTVGYKKKALTILALNTDTKDEFTNEEYMIAQTYAEKIKKQMNKKKKFWQDKLD